MLVRLIMHRQMEHVKRARLRSQRRKKKKKKTNFVVLLANVKAQRLCSFLNFAHNFICWALRSETGFSLHKSLSLRYKISDEALG